MKEFLRKLISKLEYYTKPDDLDLVTHLIMHTASLELYKHEYAVLAPVKGCTGPIKLMGNSLPVFEYNVFDKSIMEFIKVRVELAKPDTIRFICTIDSTTAPERHGEVRETTEAFKKPFYLLAYHIYRYFPLHTKHLKLKEAIK